MNFAVATIFLEHHWNSIKIVWPDVTCNYPQSLEFQLVEFFLGVDDVTSAITTDVDPVYGLTTAELITPNADLSVDAAFTEIGLPKLVPDIPTDNRLFALHTMHVGEGTFSVNEVPGLDQSGILGEW